MTVFKKGKRVFVVVMVKAGITWGVVPGKTEQATNPEGDKLAPGSYLDMCRVWVRHTPGDHETVIDFHPDDVYESEAVAWRMALTKNFSAVQKYLSAALDCVAKLA